MRKSDFMRNKIFDWLLKITRHPEATILPLYLLAARAVLFPLDSLFWHLSTRRGYQWQSDTWIIEGRRYSGTALRFLSHGDQACFRVVDRDDVITLERAGQVKAVVMAEFKNGMTVKGLKAAIMTWPEVDEDTGDDCEVWLGNGDTSNQCKQIFPLNRQTNNGKVSADILLKP